MAFGIGPANKDRLEAFEMYHQAFGAEKLSEGTPPDGGDIHIMMSIYGVEILIGPRDEPGTGLDSALICEARYDDEAEFRGAYDVLVREAKTHSLEGPFPWATLLALVTDKYGIGWALYYNEKMEHDAL